MKERQLQIAAWTISLIAALLVVVAWGQSYNWQLSSLSIYEIFPVFGLIAFSLMWAHYIVAALRVGSGIDRSVTKQYFEITSLAVLAAILLHPGLLAWQLWKDGLGLPPGSEVSYAAPGMGIFVVIAMISLLVFLAFEFRRAFGEKPWWKFVQYSSDIAILLIFLHSLKLGGHLQAGWLRLVWFFYGITLVVALGYMYYKKITTPKPTGIVKS